MNMKQGELYLRPLALSGAMVSVLATGPKVHGFKPGQGRKNLQHASLWRGIKPLAPVVFYGMLKDPFEV
jgi:hypothetical protein